MHTNQPKPINQENYIIELFRAILPYKLSILSITLFTILLTKSYLYFIPSTYESYTIIKVKVNNQPYTEDILRDSLKHTNSAGIIQEMLSLKTFKLNNTTLKEVNFSTQYFQKENYKFIELYKNSPLKIILTNDVSLEVLNKKILIQLRRDGFTLSTDERGESETYILLLG